VAAINGKITISTCEGRPCWVDGRRAIFHRWTDSARPAKSPKKPDDEERQELPLQIHNVHGLVEYEDGTVDREWPNRIRFADSTDEFARFDWDAMERERDLPWIDPQPAAGSTPREPLQERQEEPEVLMACETCAHEKENEAFCKMAKYNCKECTVRGCYCKRCRDFDRWEAKEGTA
jgi:hypothetical protein